MKIYLLKLLSAVSFTLFISTFFSCGKLVDDAIKKVEEDNMKVENVAMTVQIDGKKAEFSTVGFAYNAEYNGTRALNMGFLKPASLFTFDAVNISIADFKPSKKVYSVAAKEVVVTYNENADIYEDKSATWESSAGTVEITSFNDKYLEGKLNITFKLENTSKTKSFSSGTFKAESLL